MWLLRLIRLPAVFTAFPDVLLGYVVITLQRNATPRALPLLLLLICSGLLYMAGMVLNDCFDAEDDAVHRPERPIPSGRISLKWAFVLGLLLMVAGLLVAMAAAAVSESRLVIYAAGSLALVIWLYDGALKAWAATAVAGMGIARLLNVLLGMAACSDLPLLLADDRGLWLAPVVVAVYVAVVTLISRVEDAGQEGAPGDGAVQVVLSTGAALLGVILVLTFLGLPQWNLPAAGLLLLLAAWLARALVRAWKDRRAVRIRGVVRTGLQGIIVLDAALIAGHIVFSGLAWRPGQGWAALAVLLTLLLLLPSMLLGRFVRLT